MTAVIFKSPFNANSTAEEVVEGIDLTDTLGVATGGAAGIGEETARVSDTAGADVIIGARNSSV